MPSKSNSSRRNKQQQHLLNINTSLGLPSSTDRPRSASFSHGARPNTVTASTRDIAPPGVNSSNRTHTPRLNHDPASGHNPDVSFLDNCSPVDAEMADQHVSRVPKHHHRDSSHDLSLNPRNVTRDSLVNNMLLSLDQFSIGQSNATRYDDRNDGEESPRFFDIPRYRPGPIQATNHPTLWKGHGQSYSSDFDAMGEDSSRISTQTTRGRRSNSSTNLPDNYTRLNSARQPATPRGKHARGGKGSKSSSVASADGAHISVNGNGGQFWARGLARPASFDIGPPQTKPSQPLPQLEDVPQSSFQSEFNDTFLSDDFDAAPTPTIPGGPRRSPSIPTIPPPPPEPLEHWSTHRTHSSGRSLKSSSGRGKANKRDPAPPLQDSAVGADSAPAPSVGYGKSKEAQEGLQASTNNAPLQPKERPGFFKRVFGGFQNATASSNGPSVDSKCSPRTNSADVANTESPSRNKMPPESRSAPIPPPPSRDTASAHSNHPTLQKKSSSFFRRRKKSVADEAPPVPSKENIPPVPPINLKTDKDCIISKGDGSSVSSLRQVMNPYLRESAATPATPAGNKTSALSEFTNTDDKDQDDRKQASEYKRDFSPDYEPSPNARIRKVQSSNLDFSRDDPTSTPSKAPTQKQTKGNSFLDLDCGSDCDNESTPQATRSTGQLSKQLRKNETPRPKKRSSFVLVSSVETSPRHSGLALPLEGVLQSGSVSPRTPTKNPDFRVDSPSEPSPKTMGTLDSMKDKPLDEPDFIVGEPTEDDRSKAQQIYDGNEDFIQKGKAASWMGEEGPIRQRTLQAYMELYDFENHSIVSALRQVCGRLVLRAETQQVDRILVAFSDRWCKCNPNHGFKAIGKYSKPNFQSNKLTNLDIIHTICYSIMLLNTDLHMADIEQKMTRSQFVKNTMGTVTQALAESAPDAFEGRPSVLPEKISAPGAGDSDELASTETEKKLFRNSFRPPPRADADGDAISGYGPLVKAPYHGSKKGWEEQIEVVLKSIYNSIRDERLPLFGADPSKTLATAASQSSLSVIGMLRRTPSVLSKAPSEGNLSMRGRNVGDSRSAASRWTSKSRSRPGLGRTGFSSSRTSFDDGNLVWSPALSSATWSRQSLGRTQTTISQDSFGSAMRGDYQQSIGFANALSQAIIRDEDYDGTPSILSADVSPTQLLEDESLEITGPPWVKEGMVIHKHHLDGIDKKAKERQWTEVFAVIQKGQMSLFSFNANKSMRQKNRSKLAPQGGPVGGGNWQDNATSLGTFSLRQTLASALPPPGYSRTRPHVWALSLPTGAVHLFQVGTPDIIKEFVTTANYWSARLSTHPLIGGISNVEYGWSDAIVNNSLVSAINENTENTPPRVARPPSSATTGRKGSISSFRSTSVDHATAAFTHATGRGKLPGDRIHMAEWTPPTQSLRPSNQPEAEQLQTLTAYVKGIEDELQVHNQLRSPMLLAFTPRGHNAGKAMANWERKSAYLLREIVKFRTYVDCLQQAESRKQEVYAERNLAHRAARGELSDREMEVSGGEEEADETLRP